ncbi:hypothetical protein BDZ94DRAFT_1313929 [Collybia nuda]|uniref:Uncharacterized protein n=1 Tax=Collybia nuda TaxID=64659 RepID=A0A9P6CE93_9AGAR|nr:hypothetical protein BDZ94DRAFT_1313929 [Collybia nuda]
MFSKTSIVLSAILSLVVMTQAAPSTDVGGPAIIYCSADGYCPNDLTCCKSILPGGPVCVSLPDGVLC